MASPTLAIGLPAIKTSGVNRLKMATWGAFSGKNTPSTGANTFLSGE